jgi:hypothetical protein
VRNQREQVSAAAHAGSSLAEFSPLKMEAIPSSETSVHTRSTWRHIPEDGILHSHCCENLKSYNNLLNWKNRVELILLKLSEVCFLVRSLVFLKSKALLKTACFSYFYSVVIYDITFWSNSSDRNKVFLLQKKVIRIMAGAKQKE